MVRVLWLMLVGLVTLVAYSREASACSCTTPPPALLIPQPGTSHPFGAPLVVGHGLATDAFLYGPEGDPVSLSRAGQATGLGLCAGSFTIYHPVIWGTEPTTLTLWLTDEVGPHFASTFEAGGTHLEYDSVVATLEVTREAIEPQQVDTGSCADPILAGATIVGYIQATVTLSRPEAMFVEAWVDDDDLGRIRDFRSTAFPVVRSDVPPVGDRATVELALTAASVDCINLSVYDWAMVRHWHEEFCLEDGSNQSLAKELSRVPRANLPDEIVSDPWGEPAGAKKGGCQYGATPGSAPSTLALILVAFLRLGARRS